jgi:hypothetical protein
MAGIPMYRDRSNRGVGGDRAGSLFGETLTVCGVGFLVGHKADA